MTALRLSVVIVAFDMARELPRTLQTLSSSFQQDIAESDYEIIVIDNGSNEPFDHALCHRLCPNLQIHEMPDASPSPVPAINYGLALARGEVVGVWIDGARMASPRLLATALEAAGLHPRPIVATLAFHLGPDFQYVSIHHGYSRQVEDDLLATVDWQSNGYLLFSISVFAGSSDSGWFRAPAESNALFLKREHWLEMGGYDQAFVAPAGGLANLDIWLRLCEDADPDSVMMLLGEATFHQIHRDQPERADRWDQFHDEYVRVRGKPYAQPQFSPRLYGRLPPEAYRSVEIALEREHSRLGMTAP